jgi:hypothetical protein
MFIAPCGMNCRVCRGHMREKKPCAGCRGDDANKSISCIECGIRQCANLKEGGYTYCFSCKDYPCRRIKQMDKRYRTRYGMSVIENLEAIKTLGIRRFIASEKQRWMCAGCGELVCVHHAECLRCGKRWR